MNVTSSSVPDRARARGRGGLVLILVLAGVVAASVAAWGVFAPPGEAGGAEEDDAARQQLSILEGINRSEDLIQWLSSKLGDLNGAVMNLEFPSDKSLKLFEDEVAMNRLVKVLPSGSHDRLDEGLVHLAHWEVSPSLAQAPASEAEPWAAFLAGVDYFEHAKFYIVRGHYLDEAETLFEADMGFSGRARLSSGRVAYVHADQTVVWADHTVVPDDPKQRVWRIRSWETTEFGVELADDLLFAEVLESALPDPATLREARRSRHQELVVDIALNDTPRPAWFDPIAGDRHPGVSVVDIDRDGHDDLYVMPRLGPNQLLRNRGDGTFEEVAAEYGLDLADNTSCAVFCDFDNDGDTDAFLGRTLERSTYLENDGGRYYERPERIDVELPYCVSSINAVDYDGDGLLDVYFATYAARAMHMELKVGPGGGLATKGRLANRGDGTLLSAFLPADQAQDLHDRYQAAGNPFLERPGPPSVLLRNAGAGRFELARDAGATEVWRNTYQAVWADYDNDGDPDLYAANDFGPNNLVRNEGGGRFVDVTAETSTEDIGLGMGATWGDYDNDGAQDLYVANMFSKAGRRITAQIAALDPTFAEMARGNSLLRQGTSGFERVSSLEPPGLLVEKAGWSWGPQFFDFNNDGFLDLFALSGFYTAPEEIALPVDR